jgi:uncharacterized repeat protein (TIGR01451 family)
VNSTLPARAPVNAIAARPGRPAPLLTARGPALRIATNGPSAVIVGQEASYTVVIHNEGTTAATGVYLRVGLPSFVRVAAEGSAPDTGPAHDMDQEQRLVWSIAEIPANGSEQVTIRVTPTENRPIPLQVDWTTRPISAQTEIEVLQPQLEVAVSGPRDVLYGETAVYTIKLSNPGTGDASDVAVEFAYGDQRLEPKPLGTLSAGQHVELKVELNAREAGTVQMTAVATAGGGLRADARQELLVRRAKLEVDVEGDRVAFAGSAATYRVTVRNSGNAPAADAQVALSLPPGAKFLGGDGWKSANDGYVVPLGTLQPNANRTLNLQCQLMSSGDNQLAARLTGAGDLDSHDSWVTRVEALADLKLTVNDPQGPVAVTKEAVYELHIVNRGSKAATNIHVVAQFSQGIEPVAASGATSQIMPGQVVFNAIPRVEPGQEITLVVKARAEGEGTKRFRAEVTSEDHDLQLVAQETTFFYSDANAK